MASRLVYLVLALVAAASAAPNSRLVGGQETKIEDHPHLIALTYFYPGPGITVQRCVGSLLSSWHVLTAASCFFRANLNQFVARAGSTNSLSGGVVVSLHQVIEHPDHVANPREADIAVILLQSPLGMTSSINVAFLPPAGTHIPDGTVLDVVSWGFEAEGGNQLENLKAIQLNKISTERCQAVFAGINEVAISDRVICGQAPGRSTCFGDAGAPMVIGGVVVGTASYYQECGSDVYPDVFSRVDIYTNWILSVAVPPRRDIDVPFPGARSAPVSL